jgi:hypothetical protein
MQREFVEGDEVDDLELVVIPSAMISGRVYDESGRGIVNAQVWANKQQSEDEGWNGAWIGGSTITASDGRFEFASLPPGKYQVNARAAGYTSANVEMEAGGPPAEIPLTRASWIEGLVVDAESGGPGEGRVDPPVLDPTVGARRSERGARAVLGQRRRSRPLR